MLELSLLLAVIVAESRNVKEQFYGHDFFIEYFVKKLQYSLCLVLQ